MKHFFHFGKHKISNVPYFIKFFIYSFLSILLFAFPLWGLIICISVSFCIGLIIKINWIKWIQLPPLIWYIILIPVIIDVFVLIFGIISEIHNWHFHVCVFNKSMMAEFGSILRSFQTLAVFMMSDIFVCTVTVFEIKDFISVILSPLPKKINEKISIGITITISSIPWIFEEYDKITQSIKAKGLTFKRKPIKAIKALAIPLLVRLFEKSRHVADALTVRM